MSKKLDQRVLDLFLLIEDVVKQLNKTGCLFHSKQIIEPLRNYMSPNCHVNSIIKNSELTDLEKIEWFAGQLLNVSDNEAWWAMNVTLNFFDILEKNLRDEGYNVSIT